MKNLNVYLNYNGNCAEAIEFYKKVFGGDVSNVMSYGDMPDLPSDSPENIKNMIMHAEFKAEDVEFMMSDVPPEFAVTAGCNTHLNVTLDNADEQVRIFHQLAEGGRITMPLADRFWGMHFGSVEDKYGISWMLNRPLAAPSSH